MRHIFLTHVKGYSTVATTALVSPIIYPAVFPAVGEHQRMAVLARWGDIVDAAQRARLPVDFLYLLTSDLPRDGAARVLKNCEELPEDMKTMLMDYDWASWHSDRFEGAGPARDDYSILNRS